MKNLILNIFSKLGIKSDRTKNIAKHIGWSMFYKAGSIIANFMLVPLTINYLQTDNYGVWLTLSSFIGWFSFFDIGLGNGLRNKFAEAKTNGDYKKAQGFISTAYFTIGAISLTLVAILFMINPFINWANLFNANVGLENELSILLPIVFAFFGLQLVVKLITSIYQGDQNHSIQGKIQFFGQVLSLIVIWLLTQTDNNSLLLFGSVFSGLPVLILIGLNLFAFNSKYKNIKPSLKLWNKEYLKDITGLGFKFFILQMAAVVIFSTDNFIISKLFGPEEVVPYNIAFKYFSIMTIAYSIIITPYWSTFTEAYANKDFDWIKKSVSSIQKIWILVPIALFVMVLVSEWFYKFWVGDKVEVPLFLSICIAFNVAVYTLSMIYNYFINGVGKVQLHLVISIFTMLLNIPLSLFLAKFLNIGVSGVILATSVCVSINLFFLPLQYKKLINLTAKGIWNK